MNRTSTATSFNRAIEAMGQRQSRMYEIQAQLATGKKITSAADDPVAAAQAHSVQSEITRVDVERRMVDFARTVLSQADSALGTASDLVMSARDLVVQSNNATMSASDRASIASQIRGMRAELVGVANTRDGSGGHVFGGQGSRNAPFVESGGTVQFVADAGVQEVGQDLKVSTSLDGRATFMSIQTPAGSQSIFQVLDTIASVLENPASSGTDVAAAAASAIDALDGSVNAIAAQRSNVGEQLRMIDSISQDLDGHELDAQTRLSQIVDVDFAKAISDFSREQSGMQAAMQTYAQISSMSLFNYIR